MQAQVECKQDRDPENLIDDDDEIEADQSHQWTSVEQGKMPCHGGWRRPDEKGEDLKQKQSDSEERSDGGGSVQKTPAVFSGAGCERFLKHALHENLCAHGSNSGLAVSRERSGTQRGSSKGPGTPVVRTGLHRLTPIFQARCDGRYKAVAPAELHCSVFGATTWLIVSAHGGWVTGWPAH